jgi:hypothetical protein
MLGIELTSDTRRHAAATLSSIMRKFSSSGTPSASSTWRAELLSTSVMASAWLWNSAARPGSFAALRPERRVMPKAQSLTRVKAGGLAKKPSSVGLAPGQPPST